MDNLLAFQCKFNVYFYAASKTGLEWDEMRHRNSNDSKMHKREITSGLLPFAWSLSKS